MQLEKYIYELLILGNSKVLVSGFGVFKTTSHSAKIHLTTNIAYPPKRTLEFENTPSIEKNTLLQKHICEVENLEAEVVSFQIYKTIIAWKKTLETKNLNLENLGIIISKDKNKFLFAKNKNLDIMPSAFGLETFSFSNKKPKSTPSKNESVSLENFSSTDKQSHFEEALETNTLENSNELYQEYYRKIKINNMKRNFLMSAIILLIIFLMIYFILDPFNKNETLSSLTEVEQINSEIISSSVDSVAQITITSQNSTPSKNPVISESFPKNTKNSSTKITDEKTAVNASSNHPLNYYVMAGSFNFGSNARKFLKQLKSLGYNKALYLGKSKDGFYRVSYGSFYNKSKAQRFLKQIRLKLDQKAWLLISKNDQEK